MITEENIKFCQEIMQRQRGSLPGIPLEILI